MAFEITSEGGRSWNLTSDEEAKLKATWKALIDKLELQGTAANNNADVAKQSPPTQTPGKVKEKRRSTFSLWKTKSGDANDEVTESPARLRGAFWSIVKHHHPDAILLRFLRARKWDIDAAIKMLLASLQMELRVRVQGDIMFNGDGHALHQSQTAKDPAERKAAEDFLTQLRLGKSFLHGLDVKDRPCFYVRARLHKPGEQSQASLERFTLYMIETAGMMLKPPTDTATLVFDLSGFGLSNMDYAPIAFMTKALEANYPETLGNIIVYKAPWIFQGIWKIIKGWLDPVVATKVYFASGVDDLKALIPRGRIMKELGGDEDYIYTYIEPEEGENALLENVEERKQIQRERDEIVKSFQEQTISWLGTKSDDEPQIKRDREKTAIRLAENYWRLDPYVRARSVYDRLGIIQPGGKVDFYPPASVVPTTGINA